MLYTDPPTNKLFAECEHCKTHSELLDADLTVSVLLLAEVHGWWVTDDGDLSACSEEHWKAADCQGVIDKLEIDSIDEIIRDERDRKQPGLN